MFHYALRQQKQLHANSSNFYKSHRIARSKMVGEVIAFSDTANVAVTVGKKLGNILDNTVQLQLLTDSKRLLMFYPKRVAPMSGDLC